MSKKSFWKECDNKRLEELLLATKDLATTKHIQAVYLKACYNLKAEVIPNLINNKTL